MINETIYEVLIGDWKL